jgi:hypothetical protein
MMNRNAKQEEPIMNSLKQSPPWRGVMILICACLAPNLLAQGIDLYVNNDLQQTRDVSMPLGSQTNPFMSIQMAIDMAQSGQTVLVAPGEYTEPVGPDGFSAIYFNGRDVIVQSLDPNNPVLVRQTVIQAAVLFSGNETEACVLSGFKFELPWENGIYGNFTQATISHCIITGNTLCEGTVLWDCDGLIESCLIADNRFSGECQPRPVIFGCQGIIRNCTIANNAYGMVIGSALVENCIISGNEYFQLAVFEGAHATVSYSCITGGVGVTQGILTWGKGNIDSDPLVVRNGMWEAESYIPGDYHLLSQGLRWDEIQADWVVDGETSFCINAGNPDTLLAEKIDLDPFSLAVSRINMGVYGGTYQGSVAPAGHLVPNDVFIPEHEGSNNQVLSVNLLHLVNLHRI